MSLVQNSVVLDFYSTSVNLMCVQSLSGTSYIDFIETGGIEVISLPSPICFDAWRGENNDPISTKSG